MDAFSSSSSPSSTQNHVHGTEITQEEFFSFHHIDRQLFSRMVLNLRREPDEAMQVSAFWLWLERINMAQYVDTILTFPDAIIEAIFEESLLCLRAVETDVFLHSDDDTYDIPTVQSIIGNEKICLRYFYENRIKVLLGVGNIIQQVCLRAFQDLFQVVLSSRTDQLNNNRYYHFYRYLSQPPTSPPSGLSGDNDGSASDGSSNFFVHGGGIGSQGTMPQPPIPPQTPIYNQNIGQGSVIYHPTVKVGELNVCLPRNLYPNNNDLHTEEAVAEMFGLMHVNDRPYEIQELRVVFVPISERTIFLTFSKGYPISELELREFLTRSFGDIIEALYMQEIGASEQPLYARLVVRDLSAMVAVLSGKSKAKFSINGKHVWARKFVLKNPNSLPSSPN